MQARYSHPDGDGILAKTQQDDVNGEVLRLVIRPWVFEDR